MGSKVSSISGNNGESCEVGNKPGHEKKKDDDVTIDTIGKIGCIVVEVEPGKFMRKCETTEKTVECIGGRPNKVLTTNKCFSQEDITDKENVSRKPYANKYVKGQTSYLIGCSVDDDISKLPELDSFGHDSVEEMERILGRKQFIENKKAQLCQLRHIVWNGAQKILGIPPDDREEKQEDRSMRRQNE